MSNRSERSTTGERRQLSSVNADWKLAHSADWKLAHLLDEQASACGDLMYLERALACGGGGYWTRRTGRNTADRIELRRHSEREDMTKSLRKIAAEHRKNRT